MPAYNSGSAAAGYPISPDYRIAALQADFHNGSHTVWRSINVSYSFPTGSAYFDGGTSYGNGEIRAGWAPFSAAQQVQVRKALATWSAVAQVSFTEVADGLTVGDMRFGFTSYITAPTLGHAYHPVSDSASAGDVWIRMSEANASFTSGRAPWVGSGPTAYNATQAYNYMALMHEIGHALGLSHPFIKPGETRGTAVLPAAEDNYDNTVMSYTAGIEAYAGIPTTPMPYDILAIQYLYGANYLYNTGNNTYTYDVNDVNYETIWDAGGTDTLVITNTSNAVLYNTTYIDLRGGGYSGVGFASNAPIMGYTQTVSGGTSFLAYRGSGKVYMAYGVTIENVVATNWRDNIIGNDGRNVITSGTGIDVIDGGGGTDTSVYALARASYTVARTATGYTVTDKFTTTPPYGGTTLTYTGVDTLTNVERLQFSDVKLALDASGLSAAKMLGAVFGSAFATHREYLGIALSLMDGGMSQAALAQAALNAKLGVGASSTAVVNLLYTNLTGAAPSASELALYRNMIDSGQISAANLTVVAAEHALTAANIGLTGLAATGVEYI